MEYIQLSFSVTGSQREILVAQLSEAGCEGFEETEEMLIASFPADHYDESRIDAIAEKSHLHFKKETIAQQNWNAIWEAGFEPVTVPGFCTVRAAFHPPATDTPYEIIITPKMSFGTGHHATTRLMMAAMQDINFTGKSVLDFGCGTGILTILARLLGAGIAMGIDNDEWSVENALENVQANAVNKVQILKGSLEIVQRQPPFDIILANINRHILLQYMEQMRNMLQSGGILLLSGILAGDEAIITEAAEAAGMVKKLSSREGDWIALKFTS
jgi:ribosomal protein L11 methyltransferase